MDRGPRTLREEFWREVVEILDARPSVHGAKPQWDQRFTALDNLMAEYDCGEALITAPPPANSGSSDPHWVGGPEDPNGPGRRGFLVPWIAGAQTGVHGHASLMYVFVVRGRLQVTNYQLDSDAKSPTPCGEQTLTNGQAIHAIANNERSDNFIHRITCIENAWTFHLYSGDPAQTARFEIDE